MTLMEGAVCVGAPYILRLCKNMFSSWVIGKLTLCITFLERFITSSK